MLNYELGTMNDELWTMNYELWTIFKALFANQQFTIDEMHNYRMAVTEREVILLIIYVWYAHITAATAGSSVLFSSHRTFQHRERKMLANFG